MRRTIVVLGIVLSFLWDAALFAQSKSLGSLFIIGGGSRSEALIADMLHTADLAPDDHIIVLPMASAEPEPSFRAIADQISKLSPNKIGSLNFDQQSVNNTAWIDSLRRAKLIYITGGDQNRFMRMVLNTPVYDAIHTAYREGSTIAGTSAGAAVMSKHMITGRQALGDTAYRETFDKLWDDNLVFEPGLGLLSNVIVDQHFVKRSRYNRLISAMNEFPGYDCVGIDEGTALVVQGNKARISGESQVVRLYRPKGLSRSTGGLIRFRNAGFSIFTGGDTFRLK